MMYTAKMYQLGHPAVVLSGAVLMRAGLTIKFFSLDDSVMFLLTSQPTVATIDDHSGATSSGA